MSWRIRRRAGPPRSARRDADQQTGRAAGRRHVGHQPTCRPCGRARLDRTVSGPGGQAVPHPAADPAGDDVLVDLNLRVTDMFAHHLQEWSDDDVGQLNTLLARLRDSFARRGSGGCAPESTATSAVCGPPTATTTRTPVHPCNRSKDKELNGYDHTHRCAGRPRQARGISSSDGAPMTHRQIMEALTGLLLGMFVAILSSTVVSNALPEIISTSAAASPRTPGSSRPRCSR